MTTPLKLIFILYGDELLLLMPVLMASNERHRHAAPRAVIGTLTALSRPCAVKPARKEVCTLHQLNREIVPIAMQADDPGSGQPLKCGNISCNVRPRVMAC